MPLQAFQPMAAQLSKKAALPLAKILATASCRCSKRGALSLPLQASGEAEYTDNIPDYPGQLFAEFVLSTEGNATIDKIDATDALVSGGGGHCLSWGHYDVPLKWVTFGDPRVPTYGYTFGEMSLELGLIFYHRPYNWGPNSVFPAILVTRDA